MLVAGEDSGMNGRDIFGKDKFAGNVWGTVQRRQMLQRFDCGKNPRIDLRPAGTGAYFMRAPTDKPANARHEKAAPA
jgi:hypothetical protein